MLVAVLVASRMTALLLMSVFSIAFLPAVVAPVLLLMLIMLLALLVEVAVVDLCWGVAVTQGVVCLNCWTSHLGFYYAFLLRVVFLLTLEVLEAVVVVDYFRCCCCLVLSLVVLVAKLPVRQTRQELQERLDRLDPDPHYYCLSALFSPSTLTFPSLARA